MVWALMVAMLLPAPMMVMGEGDATSPLTLTAQARSKRYKIKKKSKKNTIRKARKGGKNKKYTRKSRKRNKKYESGQRVVPQISSFVTAPPAKAVTGNALLRVDVPRGMSNTLINYYAMAVNFNPSYRIPNCVAYELTSATAAMTDAPGHEKRKNYNYARDNGVKGCPDHWEYRGTGYSRGHMAPAMDMRWSPQAMRECFYMTNMCPQNENLNNNTWRMLEERIHRWAKRDGQLVIYTGPIMSSRPKMVGKENKNIAVPDAFFKVVYAPTKKRAIAFIYPNEPCRGSYRNYAVSVAEVERRTGLRFPAALPRTQSNPQAWE